MSRLLPRGGRLCIALFGPSSQVECRTIWRAGREVRIEGVSFCTTSIRHGPVARSNCSRTIGLAVPSPARAFRYRWRMKVVGASSMANGTRRTKAATGHLFNFAVHPPRLVIVRDENPELALLDRVGASSCRRSEARSSAAPADRPSTPDWETRR